MKVTPGRTVRAIVPMERIKSIYNYRVAGFIHAHPVRRQAKGVIDGGPELNGKPGWGRI
jgi:hypothetical protein